MKKTRYPFWMKTGRFVVAAATVAYLGAVVSDGKVVKPLDQPYNDCAIELRCDIPAIRQVYDIAIFDCHTNTSTSAPYIVDMDIDDDGIFYKV